jgi:hypothetical protein
MSAAGCRRRRWWPRCARSTRPAGVLRPVPRAFADMIMDDRPGSFGPVTRRSSVQIQPPPPTRRNASNGAGPTGPLLCFPGECHAPTLGRFPSS